MSGQPDPYRGVYVFASGIKGTGKSVVCRRWFDEYPFDRVVIDPTHDIRSDLRKDGVPFEELHADALPARLPAGPPDHRREARTYIFCPDMGSPTVDDDMDRVTGLALGRGPTLLWVDEFGTMTTGSKTPPNMRRVLHHGRHDNLTFLCACPRPKDINGLAINQADLVYTFRTTNPDDRERIAKNIGVDPRTFDEANQSLAARGGSEKEPSHWHTLYKQRSDEFWIMPPLPADRRHRARAGQPGDLVPLDEADEADQLHHAADTGRA